MWGLHLLTSIIVGSVVCYPSNISDITVSASLRRETKLGMIRTAKLKETNTPASGNKEQNIAFAQYPNRPGNVSVDDSDDDPHNICTCPDSSGWTDEQLKILEEDGTFSGDSSDCYCYNSSDYPNELHQRLQSLKSPEENIVLHTSEQNGIPRRESHLVVTSLDGDIRELQLGPLHVVLD